MISKDSKVYEELCEFSSLVPPDRTLGPCDDKRSCDCIFHSPNKEISKLYTTAHPADMGEDRDDGQGPPDRHEGADRQERPDKQERGHALKNQREQRQFGPQSDLEVIEEGLYLV